MTTKNWEKERKAKIRARWIVSFMLVAFALWLSPVSAAVTFLYAFYAVAALTTLFVGICFFGWVFGDLDFAEKDDEEKK